MEQGGGEELGRCGHVEVPPTPYLWQTFILTARLEGEWVHLYTPLMVSAIYSLGTLCLSIHPLQRSLSLTTSFYSPLPILRFFSPYPSLFLVPPDPSIPNLSSLSPLIPFSFSYSTRIPFYIPLIPSPSSFSSSYPFSFSLSSTFLVPQYLLFLTCLSLLPFFFFFFLSSSSSFSFFLSSSCSFPPPPSSYPSLLPSPSS